MTDFVNYTPIDLKSLLTNIENVQYNPSNIQSTILTALSDSSNGLINIVDPSNPFIFLLESACVCTTAAINESDLNTKRQYSKLAVTPDDLYLHMSDKDFVNKFAIPSTTSFTIMIELNSLLNNLVDSPLDNGKKVVIPRNTVFTVNGVDFSLQYPIQVLLFNNTGLYQISYDTTTMSPLQDLVSNIISYDFRNDSQGNKFISFVVPVNQFTVLSSQYTLQASTYFSQIVNFTQNYYYARVYYQNNNTNGKWVEIQTTHTTQVFDPLIVTALLKVVGQQVNISIPQVYINSGLISGTIRVDVYETQGNLNINMSNYNMTAFSTTFMAIDTNDNNAYTQAMNNVISIIYSDQIVNGGVSAVPFNTLRTQVINNTSGPINVPITGAQLDNTINVNGFNLVKNIDLVTNRTMLTIQALPKPTNSILITPMCIAMNTFITTFTALRQLINTVGNNDILDNTVQLADGSIVGRMTITPDTLYLNTNGQISIYADPQVAIIKASSIVDQVPIVNSMDFMFSPFYYVLDNTNGEFVVRAYVLDEPLAYDIDFVSQNPTASVSVNTNSFGLNTYSGGYKLVVTVKSDAIYKAIADSNIGIQLAYTPYGQTSLAYLNGTLVKDSHGNALLVNGERQFEFIIKTNFDVDSNDNLILNNFVMNVNNAINGGTPLTNQFTLLHYTNSVPIGFIPDSSNTLLGSIGTPKGSVVITYEKMFLTFGKSLTNLWTNCRSISNASSYQTYPHDVYMTYTQDVYNTDPTTGSIFTIINDSMLDPPYRVNYNILHKAGEVVLNSNNLPIKLHSAGDVMLDTQGKPLPMSNVDILRSFDMLFMQGVYFFTNDSIYVNYITEVKNTLVNWITNSISNIQKIMLEKTIPYFYAQKAMGMVTVLDRNGKTVQIEARQNFSVDLYVNDTVYNNPDMRTSLETQTVITLNNALLKTTISVSDIVNTLKTLFGGNVLGINLSGLGGSANYEILTLINEQETLSINKKLIDRGDGFMVTKESVNISFFNHTIL